MDVVELVDQAREVVEIGERRRSVGARFDIEHPHRHARGAEVRAGIRDVQVVLRISTVQREVATRSGDDVLDERTRKAESIVLVHPAALRECELAKGRKRISHTDVFEHVQSALVDPLDVVVRERPIGASDQAGAHGRLFGPLGALRDAGRTPTTRTALRARRFRTRHPLAPPDLLAAQSLRH